MRIFYQHRGLTPSGDAKEAQTVAGGCLSQISAAVVACLSQQRQLLINLSSGGSTMGFGGWVLRRWVLICGFRWPVADGSCIVLFLFFFFFFFFFFCGLWVVSFVIKGGHDWWSLAWEASLASLLAWGWKTHVGLEGIYELHGLVWACSRSHGAKTWKLLSYLAGWLALLMVLLSSGCLQLCCMDRKSALIPNLT